MTSPWTPSHAFQPGDRFTLRIKPDYPIERWARSWIPPLRPLLSWLQDCREEVEVLMVVTATATSCGSGDGSGLRDGEGA